MLARKNILEDGRCRNKINLELEVMKKEKYDAKHRSRAAAKTWGGLSDKCVKKG